MKKITNTKRITEEKSRTPQINFSEENFKIYLRAKPSSDPKPDSNILKILTNQKVEISCPYYTVNETQKVYDYEQVFPGGVNNQQVFNKTMINPISNALQGYNSTVFIYGMTGAGKTYTMFGNLAPTDGRYEEEGLVSMTIDYMFDKIQKQRDVKTQIELSFYQIYNENIRDLFQEETVQLNIMEDPVRGVFINGLAEMTAEDRTQTKQLIMTGIERRAMNATKSNEVSSRSHAILQFNIRRYCCSSEDEAQVLQSKFFMIDLAGNEKTSNNQSKRFIQGVNINKSLLTLGKCLSILAEKKSSFVPFRDSKLTRILKESLGGNSRTAMIACVSSERKFYEETLNTLKYSTIAKKIKNKGIKHNIKTISKEQLPNKSYIHNSSTQFQHKIKSILTEFLCSIEEKSKIQRITEDLQRSRQENEEILQNDHNHAACRQNINRIDDSIRRLNRVYDKNLQKAENTYHSLMEAILLAAKQKTNQSRNIQCQARQIQRLNEVLSQKDKQIKQLEEKITLQNATSFISDPQLESPHLNSQTRQQDHSRSIMTELSIKQNMKNPYLPRNTERSQSGNHRKLTINCALEAPTRSVLNPVNLSNTSEYSQKIKPQRQIVINLQTEKSATKSITSRDDFSKRLRETDKKTKGNMDSSQISNILEEYESQKYELNNAELSMIRKLRFFQREKSLPKSNSLNRFPLRSHSGIKSFHKNN